LIYFTNPPAQTHHITVKPLNQHCQHLPSHRPKNYLPADLD
jgi:hypothetical protein